MDNNSSLEKLREYQIASGYTPVSKELLVQAMKELDVSNLGMSKLDMDDYISNIIRQMEDVPTEYQDPLTYTILKNLFKKVEEATSLVLNHDFYFPKNLTYGTAEFGGFSAFVEADVNKEDFLILLSNELFTFANLLSKSVGMLLIDSDTKKNK